MAAQSEIKLGTRNSELIWVHVSELIIFSFSPNWWPVSRCCLFFLSYRKKQMTYLAACLPVCLLPAPASSSYFATSDGAPTSAPSSSASPSTTAEFCSSEAGITCQNLFRDASQSSRSACAFTDPVSAAWSEISDLSCASPPVKKKKKKKKKKKCVFQRERERERKKERKKR